MDIKLIIIIGFSYLYAIVEIFMSVMQRSKRTKEVIKKGDKASVWILMFSIGIGYSLPFAVGATKSNTLIIRRGQKD